MPMILFSVASYFIACLILFSIIILKAWLSPKKGIFFFLISFLFLVTCDFSQSIDLVPNSPIRCLLPEEKYPEVDKFITLQIVGLSNKEFIGELGKRMGYQFKRKGTFMVELKFSEEALKSNNKILGKAGFNFPAGSVIIDIEEKNCIGKGELLLAATKEDGLSLKQLQEVQAKRLEKVLCENIWVVAKRLRDCVEELKK